MTWQPATGDLVRCGEEFTGEVVSVLQGSVAVRVTTEDSPWYRQTVYVNAGSLKPGKREE